MHFPHHGRLEVEVRRAIKRVFSQYENSSANRMPAWGSIKADLTEELLPVIRKIQLEAIRNMFVKFGDGPAPPEAKPEALERVEDLVADIADVSIKRWKKLKKGGDGSQYKDWYSLNFGKDRATTIAVTETSLAIQAGEEIARRYLKRAGMKLVGYWETEVDPCKRCRREKGKPDRLWRRRYPRGPGSVHPRCRCRSVWRWEKINKK